MRKVSRLFPIRKEGVKEYCYHIAAVNESQRSYFLGLIYTYLRTILKVIQSKVKENYNMNYWKKKCDPGVVSCFVAQVRLTNSFLCAMTNMLRASMTTRTRCSGAALATTSLTIRSASFRSR